MADLNFNEKQAIEKLFGMPTGYVLGFSDTTFRVPRHFWQSFVHLADAPVASIFADKCTSC